MPTVLKTRQHARQCNNDPDYRNPDEILIFFLWLFFMADPEHQAKDNQNCCNKPCNCTCPLKCCPDWREMRYACQGMPITMTIAPTIQTIFAGAFH